MTEVTFYRNKAEDIQGFRVEGHAGYAEEGEDIVCSAISALVFNAINSITELAGDEPDVDIDDDEEEPFIDVNFFEEPSEKAQLLLRSLLLGLSSIESDKETSEFIQIVFEEV